MSLMHVGNHKKYWIFIFLSKWEIHKSLLMGVQTKFANRKTYFNYRKWFTKNYVTVTSYLRQLDVWLAWRQFLVSFAATGKSVGWTKHLCGRSLSDSLWRCLLVISDVILLQRYQSIEWTRCRSLCIWNNLMQKYDNVREQTDHVQEIYSFSCTVKITTSSNELIIFWVGLQSCISDSWHMNIDFFVGYWPRLSAWPTKFFFGHNDQKKRTKKKFCIFFHGSIKIGLAVAKMTLFF